MTTEEKEFRAWLERHRALLKDKSSDEICWWAKQNDFDMNMVYRVLAHYFTDRDTRTTYRIREAWFVDRELNSMNLLQESWDYLGEYLMYGTEFNHD